MKFNFKKITTVIAGAALIAMTPAVALATSYPASFDSGNTAIVTSGQYSGNDMTAATNLAEEIAEVEDSSSTGVGTDSIQLKRSSDEFNLGDNVTDFYTNLDSDELPNVLVDGEYINDQNEDFDYEQKLTLPSTSQMTHFRDRDYDDYEPTVGFHFTKDDAILNYTLEFTPTAAEGGSNFDDLESSFLEILGNEYFISAVSDAGDKITLLDSASTSRLDMGESSTITIDGETFDVEVLDISSSGATFSVNGGSSTNRLDTGDTQKVAGGDGHIGVTDVRSANFQGDNSFVEFSLGTGEIVLEDTKEVEINGDAVSQIDAYDGYKLNAYITNASTDLEKIELEWLADDDVFLTSESELTMPGFDAVKLTMSDLITGSEETTTFGTGDPFSISTTVEDGDVTIDLFYLNGTEDGFGANLGASSSQHLITNATGGEDGSTVELNLENETYFVASWVSGRDAETYVYELSNIKDNSGKNETTLNSLSGGSNVVFSDTDDNKDIGRLRLTLTASSEEDETATVKVEPISSGSVHTDRVFTAEGLRFMLPYLGNRTADGDQAIDLAGDFDGPHTTWSMNFTEENRDGDIAAGSSFQIDVSIDSDDGIEADGFSGDELQVGRTGDDYIGYIQSDLATRIDWTKDTSGLDSMELTYHGSEAYAEVFVSSTDVAEDSDATTDPEVERLIVTDDEVMAGNYDDKNLIVVGGSAVNKVAADMLGIDYPTYGDDEAWIDATGVEGLNEYIIKEVEDYNGRTAILVAGYETADTQSAVQGLLDEESAGTYPMSTA